MDYSEKAQRRMMENMSVAIAGIYEKQMKNLCLENRNICSLSGEI